MERREIPASGRKGLLIRTYLEGGVKARPVIEGGRRDKRGRIIAGIKGWTDDTRVII